MKIYLSLILFLYSFTQLMAQYPPAAGLPGSTAMHKDSSSFKNWADSCVIQRGFVNIADSSFSYSGSNYASYGNSVDALGIADNTVVSIGDGGQATFYLSSPIYNGASWDFAVFENAMNDNFLELAFVEVSSNGIDFYRFPSHSLTQDSVQIVAFGSLEPTKINGFAGKYRALYGTPFDLSELDSVSTLDIMNIVAIRIVDVIGSIDTMQSYDSYGNLVNDPWPTPFNSSGFDLDALGIIYDYATSIPSQEEEAFLQVFPNPCEDKLYFNSKTSWTKLRIYNLQACLIQESNIRQQTTIDVSFLQKGIYFLEFTNAEKRITRKIIKH
jgi:hypothetical protein